MGVGSLRGRDTENIRLVIASHSDFAKEGLPQKLIGNKDIGLLKPCKVERLAGRSGSEGKFREGGIQRLEDLVFFCPDKIKMDLITEDDHTVVPADPADSQQFLRRPGPPDRIVRIAQDEQPDIVFHNFLFKILKVGDISSVSFLAQI